MTNTFYVAANVLFDLETGKRSNVLMLVNGEGDATYFTRKDAEDYKAFVERRSPELTWKIYPTNQRPNMFVIQGVQNV